MDSPAPDKSATDTASLVARLGDVVALDLTVVDIEAMSPTMLALTFSGPALAAFTYRAGQDVMIAVPSDDGSIFRRRYTISSFDHDAKNLTVEIFLHGDGPGEKWAKAARRGDRVDAVGPRGKQPVNNEADTHLFVADQCAVPATRAMAESITTGAVTCVISLADDHDDPRIDFHEGVDGTVITLVAPSDADMVEAVRGVALGPRTHAYVNCEFSLMGAVRSALVERGLDPAAISIKPYWRRGLANAAHGEPVKS